MSIIDSRSVKMGGSGDSGHAKAVEAQDVPRSVSPPAIRLESLEPPPRSRWKRLFTLRRGPYTLPATPANQPMYAQPRERILPPMTHVQPPIMPAEQEDGIVARVRAGDTTLHSFAECTFAMAHWPHDKRIAGAVEQYVYQHMSHAEIAQHYYEHMVPAGVAGNELGCILKKFLPPADASEAPVALSAGSLPLPRNVHAEHLYALSDQTFFAKCSDGYVHVWRYDSGTDTWSSSKLSGPYAHRPEVIVLSETAFATYDFGHALLRLHEYDPVRHAWKVQKCDVAADIARSYPGTIRVKEVSLLPSGALLLNTMTTDQSGTTVRRSMIYARGDKGGWRLCEKYDGALTGALHVTRLSPEMCVFARIIEANEERRIRHYQLVEGTPASDPNGFVTTVIGTQHQTIHNIIPLSSTECIVISSLKEIRLWSKDLAANRWRRIKFPGETVCANVVVRLSDDAFLVNNQDATTCIWYRTGQATDRASRDAWKRQPVGSELMPELVHAFWWVPGVSLVTVAREQAPVVWRFTADHGTSEPACGTWVPCPVRDRDSTTGKGSIRVGTSLVTMDNDRLRTQTLSLADARVMWASHGGEHSLTDAASARQAWFLRTALQTGSANAEAEFGRAVHHPHMALCSMARAQKVQLVDQQGASLVHRALVTGDRVAAARHIQLGEAFDHSDVELARNQCALPVLVAMYARTRKQDWPRDQDALRDAVTVSLLRHRDARDPHTRHTLIMEACGQREYDVATFLLAHDAVIVGDGGLPLRSESKDVATIARTWEWLRSVRRAPSALFEQMVEKGWLQPADAIDHLLDTARKQPLFRVSFDFFQRNLTYWSRVAWEDVPATDSTFRTLERLDLPAVLMARAVSGRASSAIALIMEPEAPFADRVAQMHEALTYHYTIRNFITIRVPKPTPRHTDAERFRQSAAQVEGMAASEWRRPFAIEHTGPIGVQHQIGGGYVKEWLTQVLRDMLGPQQPYFVSASASDTAQVMPNPGATDKASLKKFRLAGRLTGKAIAAGIPPASPLPVFILRHLRGDPFTVNDWLSVLSDAERNAMMYLLDLAMPVNDLAMCLPPGVPNFPAGTPVDPADARLITEHNRQVAATLIMYHRLHDQFVQPLANFLAGLFDVVPHAVFLQFTVEELEKLFSPQFDVQEWRQHTYYYLNVLGNEFVREIPEGARRDAIDCFWTIVTAWDAEKQRALLEGVTGSRGFRVFTPQRDRGSGHVIGGTPFSIHFVDVPLSDRIPSAQTCFNCLYLPCYSSRNPDGTCVFDRDDYARRLSVRLDQFIALRGVAAYGTL